MSYAKETTLTVRVTKLKPDAHMDREIDVS